MELAIARGLGASTLPDAGGAAGVTVHQNILVDGVDVGFNFAVAHLLNALAEAAFEEDRLAEVFQVNGVLKGRRKVDLPEVDGGVKKGDAVDEVAGVSTHAADEANGGLFAGVGNGNGERLVRSGFVDGNDAGTVATKDDSMSFLGKDAAGGVGSLKHDGDLFGDAPAAPQSLSRHLAYSGNWGLLSVIGMGEQEL